MYAPGVIQLDHLAESTGHMVYLCASERHAATAYERLPLPCCKRAASYYGLYLPRL
jgi:hypothetical protein